MDEQIPEQVPADAQGQVVPVPQVAGPSVPKKRGRRPGSLWGGKKLERDKASRDNVPFSYKALNAVSIEDLAPDEQRYVDFRVEGMLAVEAMRKVDQEAGRKRNELAMRLAAGRMEKKVRHVISSITRADDMTDSQYDEWTRQRVQYAIAHDEAGIQGKLAAIKFLSEMRDRKKYANPAKLMESMLRATERLEQLNRVETLGAKRGVDGTLGGDAEAVGKKTGCWV